MFTRICNEKGAVSALVVVVAGLIIIGAVAWNVSRQPSSDDTMIKDESVMMKDGEMAAGTDTMMKKDDVMMSDEDSMMTGGGYEAYSSDKIAFAEKGKVVLFFHAPWCPYCRATDSNLTKDISTIPASVLILKTDYDTSTALKQKYGVTYQHTFVQVDAHGNQIAKWSGTETLPEILAKIK